MTRAAALLVPLALACGQPAALRGIVLDQNGHPVPGAQVHAADAETVTTDSFGQFVVPHLERAIYDLYVTLPGMSYGAVWRSLTRRDPAIVLFTSAPPAALHVATVTATTISASFAAAFLEPLGQLNFGVNVPGPPAAVTFWSGPSPSPSRLIVLGSSGNGFQRGSATFTLSDGAVVTLAVPLEVAQLVTLDGTVQVAGGCQLWRGVGVVAGNKQITLPAAISPAFSVTTGYVPELQLALRATEVCGGSSLSVDHHVQPQSETVALTMPPAPAIAAAASAGGDVSWSAPTGHVSVLRYLDTQGTTLPVPVVDVVQVATSASFPVFPAGQTAPLTYRAGVATSLTTYGPFVSLDAAALPGAIAGATERGSTQLPSP